VGPLLDLRRDTLGTLHRAMLGFGDVVGFFGHPPGRRRVRIYALFHPDDVMRLRMTGDDVYSKEDPSSVEVRAFLGNGVLNSGGSVWRRQRRILEPLFSPERVAAFFPAMAGEADRLAAAWRGAAEGGHGVDLDRDSTVVSRRVMARVLFGGDAEGVLPAIAAHLLYLSRRAFRRGVAPIRVPSAWPTPGNRKAARARLALRDAVDDVIARRRHQPADDLVSLLLHARDPEGGPGFDDAEVRDQVFPFLLAGCDQPATHLAFVLHLLGHNPEAQRVVQEEIDSVLGDRQLTIADVGALSTTVAAIKESMRLYPSAYALSRQVERDQEYGGYRIPAGAQAVCAPWVTHRHPAFWQEPERFDPERFRPEEERARHPFAYFAFGGGPHGCLGRHLAMLEMVVVTATLLRSYRIVTERGRIIPLSVGLNLRPGAPMPARVMAR
jgi:cytochrome P450